MKHTPAERRALLEKLIEIEESGRGEPFQTFSGVSLDDHLEAVRVELNDELERDGQPRIPEAAELVAAKEAPRGEGG